MQRSYKPKSVGAIPSTPTMKKFFFLLFIFLNSICFADIKNINGFITYFSYKYSFNNSCIEELYELDTMEDIEKLSNFSISDFDFIGYKNIKTVEPKKYFLIYFEDNEKYLIYCDCQKENTSFFVKPYTKEGQRRINWWNEKLSEYYKH